ncbi:MAG: nucleotidyl transferase AbiEii/AbiGii toxin family protein [Gammaproteobacteria bacterium]|nr:nucleotidyl transferase AbiEii/AbiGii toxin family protein [Gammaproteobacteria bacterium]
MRNVPASVRQRLLNLSRAQGRPFQEILQFYVMERFLFRLSQSPEATLLLQPGIPCQSSAMVALGALNSRMKDFYDIWLLSRHFDFGLATLSRAIRATFERRNTRLPSVPLKSNRNGPPLCVGLVVMCRASRTLLVCWRGWKKRAQGQDHFARWRNGARRKRLSDVSAYIAFRLPPVTRAERAETRRDRVLQNYDYRQREFLNFVLGHYVARGVAELDTEKLPYLIELKYHSVGDAITELGPVKNIREIFVEFQERLY